MGGQSVFVSYCHADRPWLDEFLEFMTSFEVELWDDARIEAGSNWRSEIEQAMQRASAAVLLVSQKFLASRFIREVELPTLLAKLQGSGRVFWIYVGHAHWEHTALAAIQTVHDLGVPLEDLRRNERRRALKKITAKIHTLCQPGTLDDAPSPAIARTLPNSLPIVLPRRPHQCFTGREQILAQLHAELSRPLAQMVQVLSGLGGAGKTEIALQYVQRFGASFPAIGWIRADDPATLAQDYVALAPTLGLGLAEAQDAIAAVRHAIERQERFLLVFDNVHDVPLVEQYLPSSATVHVLITTSSGYWPMGNVIIVDVLTQAEALAFLRRRTGQADAAAAEDIAQRLGRLPLALEQAAAYVETRARTLADYALLLDKHGLRALERGQAPNGRGTIGTTWRLAFEQLQKCAGAIELLKLCAFLSAGAIHLSDLTRAADVLRAAPHTTGVASRFQGVASEIHQLLLDELALDDAKAGLHRYSFIRAEGNTLTVHRLVQEVVRELLSNEECQTILDYARLLVATILPQQCEDDRFWKECSRLIPHALTLLTHAEPSHDGADAVVRLRDAVGAYFMGLGAYVDAERSYRSGLELAERHFTPTDRRIAQLANGLGFALKTLERHVEAEEMYTRALKIYESETAPKATAEVLNNLGVLFAATGRATHADEHYHRALALLDSAGASSGAEGARILGNLANLEYAANRLGEAEAHCRAALEIEERLFGPSTARVSIRINNLAMILMRQQRFVDAEALLRRALAIDEQLGPQHPNVGIRLYNLSQILAETQRIPDAVSLLERSVVIFGKALGPKHSRSMNAQRDLARLRSASSE